MAESQQLAIEIDPTGLDKMVAQVNKLRSSFGVLIGQEKKAEDGAAEIAKNVEKTGDALGNATKEATNM